MVGSLPIRENRVPDSRRSSLFEMDAGEAKLSLANAMHQFNSGYCDRGIAELLEPQHDVGARFDVAVILLDQSSGTSRSAPSCLRVFHRLISVTAVSVRS